MLGVECPGLMAQYLCSSTSPSPSDLSPLGKYHGLDCTDLLASRVYLTVVAFCHRKRKTLSSFHAHSLASPAHSALWSIPSNLAQLCEAAHFDGHQQMSLSSTGEHFNPRNLKEISGQLSPETYIVTYTSLLELCTTQKSLPQGELLHEQLIRLGYADNTFLNNHLVQMYGKCGSLQHARAVFENMVYQNSYSWNIMLAAYAQNGSLDDARAVFADMPSRNVVSWNAMIVMCAQNGQSKESVRLFAQMQAEGFEPNKITFLCILDACVSAADLKDGKEIHAKVVGNGWEFDVVMGSTLINMYGKCGSSDDAKAVFAKMPSRNVILFSAMIAAYARNRHAKQAIELFGQMQAESIEPDEITLVCVLDACASLPTLEQGQEIHASVVCNGWESNVVVGTALVNMYGKCGSLDDARAAFVEMPHRNVVSWSAMIAACAQNGHSKGALQLFDQMQAKSMKPDEITFISVLDACASVAALEEGRDIHANVVVDGWESDLVVGNALVNMYGKCGHVDDARIVFEEMPHRSVVSWNAMITVCAQNGQGKEALQVFGEMLAENIQPDGITFICVLTACSHMGLVADGRQYFTSMSQDYGISPSVDHYVCMVDLLGRAGQLNKAEELINSMPFQPVTLAWSSLLSSCRIHGDVERGERAAGKFSDLDEKNASPYISLANIHAAAGRWDKVEKLRKTMIDKGVEKETGHSCIEVKNVVHEFVDGDTSHPQWEHIYAELQKLTREMNEAGYVPDSNVLLRDLEEEEKEHMLGYHSEKLAIAFGLVSMPLGTPIRITKNLRMCSDCHSVIKFQSKLLQRGIIVRDAIRFHHIEHGICSCGELW